MTGFGASLVTFSSGSQIVASQMNQNFANLNQANIFTGTVSTLSSDNGKISSDGSGNLLVGGKLGVVTPGDRLDAATTAGTLYINGVQGIAFEQGGVVCGGVSSAGIMTGAGNFIGFTFTTGNLQFSISFTGNATGTYNHGLGAVPNFAFGNDISGSSQAMGVDTYTTNTIHIVIGSNAPFVCWMIV
jgi:hypothetical protein